MRKLLLLGRVPVLASMALAIFACSSGFKSGSLGAVEIERGQPIEIRALLSDSVVPSVSPLIRTAIEMAIEDFGPIHGHHVSVETLDETCSGPRWACGGRGRRCRHSGRRRHRDLVLRCGGGGIADPQRSGPLDDIAGQHLTCAHVRSGRQCRPGLPQGLLPRYRQRPHRGERCRTFQLR